MDAFNRIRRDFSDLPIDRPDPGFEFVVVGIRVANGDRSLEQKFSANRFPYSRFGVTGTANVLRDPAKALSFFPISWGATEATLPPGTSVDLWIAYQVPVSEERLMLRFDAGAPFDTRIMFPTPPPDPRFIALEDGHGIEDVAIESSDRSQLGLSVSDAVAFGDVITTGLFEIRVVDVRRGTSVSQFVSTGFSAQGGMELVVVKVHVRRIGGGSFYERIAALQSSFKAASVAGVIWEGSQILVGGVEDELDARLYLGGEGEGWVLVEAAENEEEVLLVYKDDTGIRRYMRLK